MQIQGRIQFVNPPENNRPGNIKVDGKYISVPTQLLPQFQRGSQVSVEVREKEVNGRTYYNLVNVVSNGDATPLPPKNHNSANGGGSPNVVGSVALPPHNSGSKEIFVTSFVKESTRIGKCTIQNVRDYAAAAKAIWEQVMEGKTAPTVPYATAQPRYQPPEDPRHRPPEPYQGDPNDNIDDIGRDPYKPPF